LSKNLPEEARVTETSTGIEVGREIPNFELPDQEGRPFNLAEQLRDGPIVLVFYRGDW
jgi:peroxiredoxin